MVLKLKLAGGDDPSNLQDERKLPSAEEKVEIPTNRVELRREIGIFSAVNLIIGCMIGE